MIRVRTKLLFFDAPKVQRAVDQARRRVLARAGAFVRTTARRSIRPRKGASKPGHPPHSHVGTLRKLIFFGYDDRHDSVIVGPLGLRGSNAPHVLEFGGRTVIERRRRGQRIRRRVRIAPRPFMGPALEQEQPRLPKLWANSVKG